MPQAELTLKSRLLVGAFAYFAEDAAVIGGDTIAEDTPPDVSAGYEDVPSLGCIEQVAFATEGEETEFLCPRTGGGYERTTEAQTIADFLDMQCQHYTELVHRLQFGTSAKIVAGTPATPFAKRDRKVRGWLAVKGVKQTGTTLVEILVRCEVRLNQTPPWENSYGKPTLRFQILENTDNAIEFTA